MQSREARTQVAFPPPPQRSERHVERLHDASRFYAVLRRGTTNYEGRPPARWEVLLAEIKHQDRLVCYWKNRALAAEGRRG